MARAMSFGNLILGLVALAIAIVVMEAMPAEPPLAAPSTSRPTILLPGLGEIVVSEHAQARHGNEAWEALEAAAACGASCLYRCPGDKWYFMGRGRDGRYFTVVGYGNRLATAFMSARDMSRRLADDHCTAAQQRWTGHDAMTGAY